jgi:hypothetical protein
VVSDLVLDRASDLMDLPMVTKPPIRLAYCAAGCCVCPAVRCNAPTTAAGPRR